MRLMAASPRGPVRAEPTVEQRRLSFGPAADLYDSVRPSYPPEAARWLLGDRPCRVADVGAGTGIFTRVLVALGHDVVAVEPDDEMRQKLLERTPGVVAVQGSAEAMPFDDAGIDAVTAAQSHHWFSHEAAYAEIARVLRPGGIFGPISNRRDESVEWVAELSELTDGWDGTRTAEATESFGPSFAALERAEFRHAAPMDADGLVHLIQSRSSYLVASPADRRRMVESVGDLASRLPERFELPYVTIATRARRLG
jgi:SAM-dependent methyltransferase